MSTGDTFSTRWLEVGELAVSHFRKRKISPRQCFHFCKLDAGLPFHLTVGVSSSWRHPSAGPLTSLGRGLAAVSPTVPDLILLIVRYFQMMGFDSNAPKQRVSELRF